MRIAFDATPLRPPLTGIGYYAEHLLRHLLLERPQDEFILLSNRPPAPSRPLPRQAPTAGIAPFWLRTVWMQTVAPAALGRLRPDVAHFTNSMAPLKKRVPTVVTIHDMSLKLFPRHHPARRLLTRPLVSRAAVSADLVIAVSYSAKRDIVRLTGASEKRVRVIHEAAAPEFQPVSDPARLAAVRLKYGLQEPFLLFVGTLEPRKNLPALIAAYAELKRSRNLPHRLILAGSPGWGRRQVQAQIRRLGVAGQVGLLGYVPFEDLPCLYNLAEAFVFPSLHEGFGLPVIEAMACGTPVIASRASSLGEVAGDAVEPLDPECAASIREALERVLTSAERRAELAEVGLRQASRFSWKRAAEETYDAYRSVAG